MQKPRPILLALAALLGTLPGAAPAQAQSHLHSPAALATQEGPGGEDYPFGLPRIRYQQVHDDIATMAMIKALAFRRDGDRTTAMAAWSVDMELYLATAEKGSNEMALTFALNRRSDYARVIGRRWINFPALPPPASSPCPFAVDLPFDLAFPFRAKGGLLWEAVVHGNRQGTQVNRKVFTFLDAQVPVAVKGTSTPFGTGCRGSGGKVPTSSSWIRGDGFLRSVITNLPSQVGGVLVFGVSDTRFFIYDLPYPLAYLGAPGCALLTDQAIWLPFAADPFGQAVVQAAGLTVDKHTRNIPIFCQPICLDAKANAMGVTTGPGERLLMPPPMIPEKGIARLYSLEGEPAIKGTLNRGTGLVTRFETR